MDVSYLRTIIAEFKQKDDNSRKLYKETCSQKHLQDAFAYYSIRVSLTSVCEYLETFDEVNVEKLTTELKERDEKIESLDRKVNELNFALETLTKMIVEWRK